MQKRLLRIVSLCVCALMLFTVHAFALNETPDTPIVTPGVKAKKLIMQPRSCELFIGGIDSVTLVVACQPENADISGLTWKSSKPGVAVVSPTGTVRAVTIGTTTITATDSLSRKRVNCTIKVYTMPEAVSMNREALALRVSRSSSLKAVFLPARGIRKNDKAITWATSDPSIVTVTAKGKVKAVSPGVATVTAMTVNGIQTVCEITVTE